MYVAYGAQILREPFVNHFHFVSARNTTYTERLAHRTVNRDELFGERYQIYLRVSVVRTVARCLYGFLSRIVF